MYLSPVFGYPLFSLFGLLAFKDCKIILFSNILTISISNEIYSRNAPNLLPTTRSCNNFNQIRKYSRDLIQCCFSENTPLPFVNGVLVRITLCVTYTFIIKKNRRYLFYYSRRVPGINFILLF
jgi:hypothetical protein